jgi:hypothetical protein
MGAFLLTQSLIDNFEVEFDLLLNLIKVELFGVLFEHKWLCSSPELVHQVTCDVSHAK